MKKISGLSLVSVAICLLIASCGKSDAPTELPGASAPASASASAAATPAASASVAAATATTPTDFAGRVQAAVDQLAAELGEEKTKHYTDALADSKESAHGELGLLAFLRQDLELATWLYGLGVQAEPNNDVYWNNFALGLHEKALLMQPHGATATGPGNDLLQLARDSFEKAASLKPDNATYQSNLGFAQLDLWHATADPSRLQAAADALKKATTLDPGSATAWAHYAEVLAAQKDNAGAADALAKSRTLAPFNGAYISASLRMPPEVMNEVKKKSGDACQINYDCKAKCPHSIIGQVNLVTCEIAQSSAQSACDAGRPYASGFDCREQIPEFGILIPGLNSGFSLITPWGRIDLTVDGRGNVEYRTKDSTSVGGIGFGITERGSWSPASGFTSVSFKPGVSYNLLGGDAAKLMGEAKMGPASISIEGNLPKTGEVMLKIKIGGGSVFSH